MRVCRFNDFRIGIVEADIVRDVSDIVLASLPTAGLEPQHDLLVRALPLLQALSHADTTRAQARPLGSVRLLSPILSPGKIIAAPDNYKAHSEEMRADTSRESRRPPTDLKSAGLFLKSSTSLVGPSQGVAQRFAERRTDYEVELVAVIGREGSDIPAASALDHVAGYSIGLDITTRGVEDRSFRKSSDGYAVLGPWFVTADEIDPRSVSLTLHQNGEPRQKTSTADMVNDVAALIAYASAFYTLCPGDLIYTGTPSGVGPIAPGDVLTAAATGIGAMDVRVLAATAHR